MPKIIVEVSADLSQEAAYQKVKDLLLSDGDLKKMDPKCTFNPNDPSCSGSLKGSQFSAELKVTGSNPSIVKLEVEVSMMLSLMKGAIESTLEKKLNKALKA